MTQTFEKKFEQKRSEMFENWISLSGQFFGDLAKVWNNGDISSFTQKDFEKSMEQANNVWNLSVKSWESMLNSLKNPDESFLSEKSMEERRKTLEKIMNAMSESFRIFYDKSMEQAESVKNNFTNMDFNKIDKELFKKWESFYEKELSRILGMPQVGLGREYQEKIACTLDKFNLFNAAVIEFIYFLYLPMEKTFILMQKDMERMIAEGKLPENSEEYYNMWLKKLEAHYMAMFHSNEYISVMAKALENMAQFKSARDSVLEDVVSSMPIPTKSEIDEMYKELSELKRTVKRLEKESKN
ncbi:MAG: poly(R)-hydroxyalkanoic acid synthase subunit PhaE [Desulforegulaceae bacterium]|nr:poly(R)-hydroxyalkanoic acid synthase subunit PhaE [Desulforegulaceae bacterium]